MMTPLIVSITYQYYIFFILKIKTQFSIFMYGTCMMGLLSVLAPNSVPISPLLTPDSVRGRPYPLGIVVRKMAQQLLLWAVEAVLTFYAIQSGSEFLKQSIKMHPILLLSGSLLTRSLTKALKQPVQLMPFYCKNDNSNLRPDGHI